MVESENLLKDEEEERGEEVIVVSLLFKKGSMGTLIRLLIRCGWVIIWSYHHLQSKLGAKVIGPAVVLKFTREPYDEDTSERYIFKIATAYERRW